MKLLVLHFNNQVNKTLSYQSSWIRNMKESLLFKVHEINLVEKDSFQQLISKMKWNKYKAIVLLHSVFSNTNYLTVEITERLSKSKVPVIYFVGNEYKLMDKKMEMCDQVGISMLITQSNSLEVIELYKKRLGCKVGYLPNVGLDTGLYKEHIPYKDRKIDFGYRSFPSPWYLGHNERVWITDFFAKEALKYNLNTDISLDPEKRLDEKGWANFLNICKAQLGTEAGGDFFTLDDSIRKEVVAYTKQNLNISFEDVFEKFFKNRNGNIPLRIMSSRNIETAGTKTLQILFEGNYNGHFKPDEHYISLKKDFSNIDEVINKFRDNSFCLKLIENAYELVHEEFTYDKLLKKLHGMITELN